MEYAALLRDLERIPLVHNIPPFTGIADLPRAAWTIDSKLYGVEVVQGLEDVAESLFDWRNVNDQYRALMTEAHGKVFPDVATRMDLHEHFQQIRDRGPEAARGFVSTLKGKMAEIRNIERLEEIFPGSQWELASSVTQPGWDITGTLSDGSRVSIQSKLGGESYAHDVISHMDTAPDTPFMLSSELYSRIGQARPDLVGQMINSGIENTSFTADTTHNLTLLAKNHGIDIPDGIGDALPYVAEVVLAIRLILDVAAVEGDLKNFPRDQKTRLQALRALLLLQRFGVTALLVGGGGAIGATAGTAVPGPGTAIGGITGSVVGAVTAAKVNRLIRPYTLNFALELTGMSEDDLFYFQNKRTIDQLARNLQATNA